MFYLDFICRENCGLSPAIIIELLFIEQFRHVKILLISKS
jgi:hypothetical protein